MNWSSFRVMGKLQGNLRLRELMINWLFFPQISLHPGFVFNPSTPVSWPANPPAPGSGITELGAWHRFLRVAWVIYRIQTQTGINPLDSMRDGKQGGGEKLEMMERGKKYYLWSQERSTHHFPATVILNCVFCGVTKEIVLIVAYFITY